MHSSTFGRHGVALVASLVVAGATLLAAPARADAPGDPLTAVDSYLANIDQDLLSGSTPSAAAEAQYATANTTAASLLSYESTRATNFHRWVQSHGDTYLSVVSAVDPVSETVNGDTATISANVVTTMKWKPGDLATNVDMTAEKVQSMADASKQGLVFGSSDVVTSEVAADHTLTLTDDDGEWQIVNDLYVDPLNDTLEADHKTPITPATPSPATAAATPSGTGISAAKSAATPDAADYSVTYNRSLAGGYADKYWTNYNKAYLNYNSSGGDCANFVSQAMWDPSSGANLPSIGKYWTYYGGSNLDDASPIAWRYVPSQHSFFKNNPQGSAYDFIKGQKTGSYSGTLSYDEASMLVGDLFYFDWESDGTLDHTAIATAYLSDGETLVDAHNTDHKHVRYDLGYSDSTYYLDHLKDTMKIKG